MLSERQRKTFILLNILISWTNYDIVDGLQKFTIVEFGKGIDMEFPGTGTAHVYIFSRNFHRSSPLALLVKHAMWFNNL